MDNIAQNEKKAFFEYYIKEQIEDESRKAELLVIRIFKTVVPVFTGVPVLYIISNFLSKKDISVFYWFLLLYLVFITIYHRIVEFFLKRGADSFVLRFINVTIEITTISIVIISMYRAFDATAMLSGPLVMVYMIMIIMTGFRYSFRLCLFSGIMAAFQHFLLYLYMIREVPDWLIERLMDFGPSGIIQKSLYLVFAGVISSTLALYAKTMILQNATKTLENTELKNTFGQFVSNEIRDIILNGKIDINGEEREGVILFTDIINFNEFLNETKPTLVVSQLNEYLKDMVKVISDNFGVINKFVSDDIMAVFGLIDNKSNSEFCAVKCAVLMQQQLDLLNQKWSLENKFQFKMCIGITSGPFVAGNIGSKDRKEFTCIGDTVNTASRLGGIAKKFDKGVVVSEELKNKLEYEMIFNFAHIGDISLKGKQRTVNAYSVELVV